MVATDGGYIIHTAYLGLESADFAVNLFRKDLTKCMKKITLFQSRAEQSRAEQSRAGIHCS